MTRCEAKAFSEGDTTFRATYPKVVRRNPINNVEETINIAFAPKSSDMNIVGKVPEKPLSAMSQHLPRFTSQLVQIDLQRRWQ